MEIIAIIGFLIGVAGLYLTWRAYAIALDKPDLDFGLFSNMAVQNIYFVVPFDDGVIIQYPINLSIGN